MIPHKGGGGGGRSQFNGTSTPKGSYSAKTGDNDCNVNSSRYSLSHCVRAIRYLSEAKSEQNVRQDLIPSGTTWRLLSCTPSSQRTTGILAF